MTNELSSRHNYLLRLPKYKDDIQVLTDLKTLAKSLTDSKEDKVLKSYITLYLSEINNPELTIKESYGTFRNSVTRLETDFINNISIKTIKKIGNKEYSMLEYIPAVKDFNAHLLSLASREANKVINSNGDDTCETIRSFTPKQLAPFIETIFDEYINNYESKYIEPKKEYKVFKDYILLIFHKQVNLQYQHKVHVREENKDIHSTYVKTKMRGYRDYRILKNH